VYIRQSSAETRVSRSPTRRCCYLRNEKSRRITDATVILPVVFPRQNIIDYDERLTAVLCGMMDRHVMKSRSAVKNMLYKNKRIFWNSYSFLALYIVIILLLDDYYIILLYMYTILNY